MCEIKRGEEEEEEEEKEEEEKEEEEEEKEEEKEEEEEEEEEERGRSAGGPQPSNRERERKRKSRRRRRRGGGGPDDQFACFQLGTSSHRESTCVGVGARANNRGEERGRQDLCELVDTQRATPLPLPPHTHGAAKAGCEPLRGRGPRNLLFFFLHSPSPPPPTHTLCRKEFHLGGGESKILCVLLHAASR